MAKGVRREVDLTKTARPGRAVSRKEKSAKDALVPKEKRIPKDIRGRRRSLGKRETDPIESLHASRRASGRCARTTQSRSCGVRVFVVFLRDGWRQFPVL